MDKPDLAVDASDKSSRPRWPRWKKIGVAAIILAAVVALAVGLGVGLSRRNSGDDSDEGNDDGDDDSNLPTDGPQRDGRWNPSVDASWQIILKRPIVIDGDGSDIEPDVEVWDLDMYDNEASSFKVLQDQGKHVICYFSAGSWENWRDDKDQFDDAALGKVMDGWPDEKWLDVRSSNVRDIMKKRLEFAWKKGCDAVDPDNVDGYQNDTGFDLTEDDAVDFLEFLSTQAHGYNMSIGLKNAGDIIPKILPSMDFSVNEQCVQYSECETFEPFVEKDKPVFHIEYPDSAPKISAAVAKDNCSGTGKAAGAKRFRTVLKKMDLDGWVQYCDGDIFETDVETSS